MTAAGTNMGGNLRVPFDLSSERRREAQSFSMSTEYVHLGLDGRRHNVESYALRLQYAPKTSPAGTADQFTCSELQLRVDEGAPMSIPELKNLVYVFDPTSSAPLWGIPQERFMSLTVGDTPLPFSVRYASYINFIDFHSFNDILTRPIKRGRGIQGLTEIGQRIVHPLSFIEAPLSFGAEIGPGSTFRNGEVTLELKGVSVVDGAACAIVAYDAGESKLKMNTRDATGAESVTEGGSHYKGDIHVDLATRWVRRATLDEYRTTETSTLAQRQKTYEYTVRHILLHLIR